MPRPPGNLGDYYFGHQQHFGGADVRSTRRHCPASQWTIGGEGLERALGINPRFFYQYYYLDSAAADTLYTTEYLYLMGQRGAGHWRWPLLADASPVRSFYLLGSINGEVGTGITGLDSRLRHTHRQPGDREQSTFLLDHTSRSRGCTYLRGFVWLARPVFESDIGWILGLRVQLGTG